MVPVLSFSPGFPQRWTVVEKCKANNPLRPRHADVVMVLATETGRTSIRISAFFPTRFFLVQGPSYDSPQSLRLFAFLSSDDPDGSKEGR